MDLLTLKNKLEKGRCLGGKEIYIKSGDVICGIESIYKDKDNKYIALLKSKEETILVDDFLEIIEQINNEIGNVDVFISDNEYNREEKNEVESIEFAQYETMKVLFINI